MTKKRPFGNYGLSIVLGGLFLLSWFGPFVAQMMEVRLRERRPV